MRRDDGQGRNLRTNLLAQEFQLLSMTELRNGPGEVLDRVAEKGEAFIIERGGHRKACLVPLSLFFPDISTTRIADELKELEEHHEDARTTINADRELAFEFRQTVSGVATKITIVLPHGYPNQCPRVYADPVDKQAPHRWADGALCVFGVMSVWNPGKHTVRSALSLARDWLDHYDTWMKSGRWPKAGFTDE